MNLSSYISDNEYNVIKRRRLEEDFEEYKYLHLLEDIMNTGEDSDDRTGVGTRKIFGTQLKFDLSKGFPALTTKKLYWKGVVEELLWFIRGDTNANHLMEKGVHIWDGNTSREFLDKQGLDYPEGFIGPGYGWQWRRWNRDYYTSIPNGEDYDIQHYSCGKENGHKLLATGHQYPLDSIDQLSEALDKIKNKPDDRRILVSAWNPSQVPEMALPPCHLLFQFQVSNGKLHCQWYQRSVDSLLGLPFNIASYALITHLFAKAATLEPGTLTFCGGDTHVYKSHFEQVKEQCSRIPYQFPTLEIPDVETIQDIENLTLDDCKLIDYKSHKAIKAEMAV